MTGLITNIPTLETKRLILRAPGPQDHEVFAAFLASDATAHIGGKRDEPESWRYLCQVIGHWQMRGCGRWMVTLKGSDTAIGLVGLHQPLDWPEREVGWYVWSGTGKGYAREAGRAALHYAYDTLGWPTAVSMIDPGNDASVRVAEAMGAVREPDYEMPRHGPVMVYRHPAPEVRTA